MASSVDRAARLGLVARAKDPGFTPGVRDLGGLLELVADEDDELAEAAERAILRIEAQYAGRVADAAIANARAATRPARGRLTRLVGRLAARDAKDEACAWLIEALGDADEKTRRNAARALGKLAPSPEIEEALLRAWDAASNDADKRAIGDALGKVGGDVAKARIRSSAEDPAFARAAVLLDRRGSREAPGAIDVASALEGDAEIRFFCRDGLEEIVAEELGAEWRPASRHRGAVDAILRGPLSRALAVRTATHAGFPLAPIAASDDLAADVVRVVSSAPALALLRAYTRTEENAPIRFRVHFVRGGHRRAIAWRCAELTRQANCGLVNDPTASTWEAVVDDADGRVAIVLVPRGFEDTRFAYRASTVAASSHPTIAAAIARAAPHSDRDVVWDPFMGAGAELVERALLGPYASLLGTDIDPKALEAARGNLERAGVRGAKLERTDSTTYRPSGITLILSNPPMGRRVARGEHHDLLARFAEHAARILKPGGALVWTVPEPKVIHPRAEASGLLLERGWPVDIGGFTAVLSIYRKRSR